MALESPAPWKVTLLSSLRKASLRAVSFKLVVWPILLPLERQTLPLSWLTMLYLGSMLLSLDWLIAGLRDYSD
jgi:hypothetical protein